MDRRLLLGQHRLMLGPLAVLSYACQGDLDATLDLLPQRYPNQVEAGDEVVSAVVFSPPDALGPPRGALALARAVETAPAGELTSDGGVGHERVQHGEVTGSVELRDVDADGRRDVIARFDVAELEAQGLLQGTHAIEVRIEGTDATWTGRDRLFGADSSLVVLPEPSGPFDVGTAALLVFDPSRAGNTRAGRALPVRLWYPASESDRQPAPYFLDRRQAERNLRASPLPLPDDLYEATHGFARELVPAAGDGPHPALILSTEWGAPVETYAALAEDFASHGYLVFGINHPNGSGAVVYPDGSEPDLDIARVVPDEANNLDWALDIEHVASWLQNTPSDSAARASVDASARSNVRAALAELDRSRIVAAGHSFGGAAAVRADAESTAIAASADLDGALVGDAALYAESARSLLLTSPAHSELDSSIDTFLDEAGANGQGLTIEGTLHSNFGDTSWLYARVLDVYPDLTREGYQLGPIAPLRAHSIITSYLRAFFQAALDGTSSPLLEGPNPQYPEVGFR
jgi:dienelactone hydrolase